MVVVIDICRVMTHRSLKPFSSFVKTAVNGTEVQSEVRAPSKITEPEGWFEVQPVVSFTELVSTGSNLSEPMDFCSPSFLVLRESTRW